MQPTNEHEPYGPELEPMRDEDKGAHDYTETWCKGGEIGHVELSGGGRVRYLRAGSGPPLILLHTVRTQLDHFQLVIPRITDAFTVYAVDFPGMSWSDIVPGASYEEPALRGTREARRRGADPARRRPLTSP